MRNETGGFQVLRILAVLVVIGIWFEGTSGAQPVDWAFFEDVIYQLSEDVVVDFYKDDLTAEGIARLKNSVRDITAQLTEYRVHESAPPTSDDFANAEQLVEALRRVAHSITENTIPTSVKTDIALLERMQRQRHSATTDDTETPVVKPLALDIRYTYRPKNEREFKPLNEDDVLQSGDNYKVIFTPEEDSYVYIFQRDSSGAIYQLFPMERFGDVEVNNFNPVRGGQTYYIPAEDKSFRLDNQIGKETLYFVVSRQRDVALEKEYHKIALARQQSDTHKIEIAYEGLTDAMRTKGLAAIDPDKEPSEVVSWEENEQPQSLLQHRLEGECNNCVNTLSFTHQ